MRLERVGVWVGGWVVERVRLERERQRERERERERVRESCKARVHRVRSERNFCLPFFGTDFMARVSWLRFALVCKGREGVRERDEKERERERAKDRGKRERG